MENLDKFTLQDESVVTIASDSANLINCVSDERVEMWKSILYAAQLISGIIERNGGIEKTAKKFAGVYTGGEH